MAPVIHHLKYLSSHALHRQGGAGTRLRRIGRCRHPPSPSAASPCTVSHERHECRCARALPHAGPMRQGRLFLCAPVMPARTPIGCPSAARAEHRCTGRAYAWHPGIWEWAEMPACPMLQDASAAAFGEYSTAIAVQEASEAPVLRPHCRLTEVRVI